MRAARLLFVAALALGFIACGGDDDGGAAASQACLDLKAIDSVDAADVDDMRAIAARDGVPDDLRAAINDVADLIGQDQAEATDAPRVLADFGALCDRYEADS